VLNRLGILLSVARPWQISTVSTIVTLAIVSIASIIVYGRIEIHYLITGIVAALIVSYSVSIILVANRATLQQLISERTRDLAHANDLLQAEVAQHVATAADLEAAHHRVEEANQVKTEFLNNIGHELRTPLNVVIGMSELLIEGDLDDADKHCAQSILICGKDLLGLIEGVLEIADFDRTYTPPQVADMCPKTTLMRAIAPFADRAHRQNLAVNIELDSALPETWRTDERRVRQILSRLLDNAIKFTQQGSVTIKARLAADGTANVLRIEVRDTGCGVQEDLRDQVFEAFIQQDSSTRRIYGGAGIGLTVARRLSISIGGKIGLKSHGTGGTTCWFTVPFQSEPR